jgi:hypothetical protein
LSYAKIATIPVEAGLVSSWLPSLLYVFMGTSKVLWGSGCVVCGRADQSMRRTCRPVRRVSSVSLRLSRSSTLRRETALAGILRHKWHPGWRFGWVCLV